MAPVRTTTWFGSGTPTRTSTMARSAPPSPVTRTIGEDGATMASSKLTSTLSLSRARALNKRGGASSSTPAENSGSSTRPSS